MGRVNVKIYRVVHLADLGGEEVAVTLCGRPMTDAAKTAPKAEVDCDGCLRVEAGQLAVEPPSDDGEEALRRAKRLERELRAARRSLTVAARDRDAQTELATTRGQQLIVVEAELGRQLAVLEELRDRLAAETARADTAERQRDEARADLEAARRAAEREAVAAQARIEADATRIGEAEDRARQRDRLGALMAGRRSA